MFLVTTLYRCLSPLISYKMVITLWSGAIANVSWVQYVVLAKNLFLAAKGPAEEAAREKRTREGVGDECDIVPLCDTGEPQ